MAAGLLMLIGGIIAIGFLGNIFFERTHISDTLLLIGIGILLGPALQVITPDTVRPFMQAGRAFLLAAFSFVGTIFLMLQCVFHSVSAFCNAGFSLFGDSLAGFSSNPLVLQIFMALIAAGGMGFFVLPNLGKAGVSRLVPWRASVPISRTARLVLASSALPILAGVGTYAAVGLAVGTLIALVDRVSLRDAFFESFSALGTVGLSRDLTPFLPPISKLAVVLLMFIGRVMYPTFVVRVIRSRKLPEDSFDWAKVEATWLSI